MALTLAFAAWYVVGHWSGIRDGLDSIGLSAALGAVACALIALAFTMLVWRALMAGLGSPLPVGVASRVLFVGQLGKYLPGSVWPVLAQMELASEHKVPRVRTAAASVISMCLSLLCACSGSGSSSSSGILPIRRCPAIIVAIAWYVVSWIFTSTGTAKALRRPRLRPSRHYSPPGRIRRQLVLDRTGVVIKGGQPGWRWVPVFSAQFRPHGRRLAGHA